MPTGVNAYLVNESGLTIVWQSGALSIAGYDYVSGTLRRVAVDQSGQLLIEANVSVTTDVSGQSVRVSDSGGTMPTVGAPSADNYSASVTNRGLNTLSFSLGYDETNTIFKRIRINQSGQLRTSDIGNLNVTNYNSGYVWSNTSGGSVLGSGPCDYVMIRHQGLGLATLSGGVLLVGANTAGQFPYTTGSGTHLSGAFGMILQSGESKEFKVNNLNALRVMSVPVSGTTANVLAFGNA